MWWQEVVGTGESLRCDANHRERLARQADLAADDVRVGAELLRPGLVGQDDDGIAPGHAIFVGHERAPECWADVKDVEEVGTDREPICALRGFVASASEGDTHQVGRGESLEALRAVAQVGVIGIRDGVAAYFACRQCGAHRHQPVRVWYRQRPKHQAICDAEHRGVRADANGDREDGDQREPRVLRQHPRPMPQVLPDRFEHEGSFRKRVRDCQNQMLCRLGIVSNDDSPHKTFASGG